MRKRRAQRHQKLWQLTKFAAGSRVGARAASSVLM
jgi:hypothetical protein